MADGWTAHKRVSVCRFQLFDLDGAGIRGVLEMTRFLLVAAVWIYCGALVAASYSDMEHAARIKIEWPR